MNRPLSGEQREQLLAALRVLGIERDDAWIDTIPPEEQWHVLVKAQALVLLHGHEHGIPIRPESARLLHRYFAQQIGRGTRTDARVAFAFTRVQPSLAPPRVTPRARESRPNRPRVRAGSGSRDPPSPDDPDPHDLARLAGCSAVGWRR